MSAPGATAARKSATGSGPPLVEARGATRILPETVPVTLVEEIDLAIGRGELVSITGPSGSGKSSLLYLLGLLDAPTAGEILFEGRPTHELDKDAKAAIRLSGIGFVFQFHFLLPEFTVIGNVMIPMRRLRRWQRPIADNSTPAAAVAALNSEIHASFRTAWTCELPLALKWMASNDDFRASYRELCAYLDAAP